MFRSFNTLVNFILPIFGLIYFFSINCDCYRLNSFENESLRTTIKNQTMHYTARVGDTVVMPCEIENRRDANVLWQFKKGNVPETISVGNVQYRQDYRVRVFRTTPHENSNSESWNLEIRRINHEDEGYYTCRVMTETESLKRVVYLKVKTHLSMSPINPSAEVNKSLTIYCNTSFQMNDTMRKKNPLYSRLHINWFIDGEKMNKSIGPERFFRIEYFAKPFIWSKLTILKAQQFHHGIYMCKFRFQNISTALNIVTAFQNKGFFGLSPSDANRLQTFNLSFFIFILMYFIYS